MIRIDSISVIGLPNSLLTVENSHDQFLSLIVYFLNSPKIVVIVNRGVARSSR